MVHFQIECSEFSSWQVIRLDTGWWEDKKKKKPCTLLKTASSLEQTASAQSSRWKLSTFMRVLFLRLPIEWINRRQTFYGRASLSLRAVRAALLISTAQLMKWLTFSSWRRPLNSLNTKLYQQTGIPIMLDNYTQCFFLSFFLFFRPMQG